MRLFALFIFFLIVSASGKVWLGIHSGGTLWPGLQTKEDWDWDWQHSAKEHPQRYQHVGGVFFFYITTWREGIHIYRQGGKHQERKQGVLCLCVLGMCVWLVLRLGHPWRAYHGG